VPEAQKASLPADLQTAEADLLNALKAALASGKGARWGATLRFENLRVLPVALRLFQSLRSLDASCRLLWPDAGAAALARRDAADFADSILDFNQWSAAGGAMEWCWQSVHNLRITSSSWPFVRSIAARW
jgi:hypothetical protein